MVHSVQDMDDFKKQLKDAGTKLVVVDFTATWCGPCRQITPTYLELAAQYKNVVFLKVDVDEAGDVAQECNIECMPTFHFYKNEKMVYWFSGGNKEKLVAGVKDYA